MTKLIISEYNQKLLGDGIQMVLPDLAGYDEIYVMSPRDLRSKKGADTKSDTVGIELLERGELASRLSKHPEHYGAFLATLIDLRDMGGGGHSTIGEATLSISVGNGGGAFKVGFIYIPSLGDIGWERMAPSGILPQTQRQIEDDFTKSHKAYLNYVMIPHEAGHLIQHLQKGKMLFDTSIPIAKIIERAGKVGVEEARHEETLADNRARGIYANAVEQGKVSNTHTLDRFLAYRTISSVDHAVAEGFFDDHATTLFGPEKGTIFGDLPIKNRDAYANFVAGQLKEAVAASIREGFSLAGKGDLPASKEWVRESTDCLQKYTKGWRDTRLTEGRLRDEFESCTRSNFETRYGVIMDVTGAASEGTGLQEAGKAYDAAMDREFPKEKSLVTPPPLGLKK